MKILIAYATTDGQTRKIARFVADHLSDAGHITELLNVSDAEGLELARFDRAILAGSLHAGGFQKALSAFVALHARKLAQMPTLFLPVSLSAAGNDPDDWAGLTGAVTKFLVETVWEPGRIEHVAGAFRFSEYDFFRSWAMKRIAAQKGEAMGADGDKEYTDWAKLAAVLTDWLGSLPQAAQSL
jgi:menaquinone-dependent protoporphyrinogen oxidase